MPGTPEVIFIDDVKQADKAYQYTAKTDKDYELFGPIFDAVEKGYTVKWIPSSKTYSVFNPKTHRYVHMANVNGNIGKLSKISPSYKKKYLATVAVKKSRSRSRSRSRLHSPIRSKTRRVSRS